MFVFVDALSIINVDSNVLMQKCKNLDNLSPAVRLKKYLLCDYDSTVHPNYPKTTNVTLTLIPKHIDFTWNDPHLTWTPSDYSEITYIQIYNWHIWTPDLIMTSFADILSDEHVLPLTRLVTNSGEIVFVSKVKFISKCNDDFTYWPYDKHECSITFISWMHIGEEVNLLIYKDGISMSRYMDDTTWDFKFINSTRVAKKYKCCPDDKFPMVTYNFLLTRHYGKHHSFIIIPAIALMLLILTVFCLDLNSIERMTVASLNFICHLLCMYVLQWTMPYNGANSPNIMLFYRDSLTLATFAILLTALIRKLKSMNTEIPNWILFTTTFVLSNNVGRFLIFNDKSKITDTITERSSDVPKSEMSMKEPSWKHFAVIIDWLFFFCMTITYVIILIVLVPVG
ncbi:neuronal acetylcholine receptor subunit alpha-9-like isoform X2 [Solenopsis invicta]|uniref:neuronal acetylcholine receptor subunit alpha-9-like isoform X2 n=1 Tax=Solenopsis invicta TaxID=13686 RepID=UPI00193E0BE4|nr:neuronal acetylcholine receptor subunit alpha-9-like isoform X2 [Solenopsis invicta]